MGLNYGKIDYKTIITPDIYTCSCCGAKNVKLWRDYGFFLHHIDLFCASCAAKNQNKDISTMNEDGTYIYDKTLQRTDQIGWLVPAIPTEEGDTFWGYTSVPSKGCSWWRLLPLK